MNMEVVEEKMIKRHCPRLIPPDRLFLCEDILVNVLSKLPVKTLLRFRCVCKRWRYLISEDPYFLQLHSQQSKCKQPHLLFSSIPDFRKRAISIRRGIPRPIFLKSMDREGNRISRFKVEFRHEYATIVPTCFDLVCIRDDMVVHICNPSTHEFISLPRHPYPLGYSSVGFGYVQSTDEYKVVGLINPDYSSVGEEGVIIDADTFNAKCHVFSLGMGMGMERRGPSSCDSSSWAWREVGDAPYHINYSTPPAFVNGAIHWLVLYNFLVDYEVYDEEMIDPNNSIIAFDVESEEFRLVPHPEGCPDVKSIQENKDYPSNELQLVELRGFLCLSFFEGSKMDIWMLKDYSCESGNDYVSGTWEKKYNIDLNILHHSYQMGENPHHYYVPRDVEDTEVLIETYMKGLGFYDLQSMSFKGFMHSRRMRLLQFSFYVESLRSLKQLVQN